MYFQGSVVVFSVQWGLSCGTVQPLLCFWSHPENQTASTTNPEAKERQDITARSRVQNRHFLDPKPDVLTSQPKKAYVLISQPP